MPAPRLRNNCRMLGIAERCEEFGDRRCAARHIVSHSTRYGRIGIRRDGRHADTFGIVKYLLGARRGVASEHLDRRGRQRIHIAAYARLGTAHTRILLRAAYPWLTAATVRSLSETNPDGPTLRDNPKSISTIRPSFPNIILSGLTSKCTMP